MQVLPPTSLILKIWTAWGEEQDCVSFTVKRVKRGPEREEEEEAGGRRRVRRRSSKAGDTLHPRALVRGRYSTCLCLVSLSPSVLLLV